MRWSLSRRLPTCRSAVMRARRRAYMVLSTTCWRLGKGETVAPLHCKGLRKGRGRFGGTAHTTDRCRLDVGGPVQPRNRESGCRTNPCAGDGRVGDQRVRRLRRQPAGQCDQLPDPVGRFPADHLRKLFAGRVRRVRRRGYSLREQYRQHGDRERDRGPHPYLYLHRVAFRRSIAWRRPDRDAVGQRSDGWLFRTVAGVLRYLGYLAKWLQLHRELHAEWNQIDGRRNRQWPDYDLHRLGADWGPGAQHWWFRRSLLPATRA